MDYSAVFAKNEKDIPDWAKQRHNWTATTDVTKLKKLEVKMKLCCNSCEEKVSEAIRGMPGVFDLKTDKTDGLVTIFEAPGDGPSHKLVLKKLKKVDKRAEIVNKKDADNKKDDNEEKTVVVMMPNIMTPWSPYGTSVWPIYQNYNYMQHRVSCGQCLGYPDVVCTNCGRYSTLGALQGLQE